MNREPVARGVVVSLATRHADLLASLGREAASILRALNAECAPSPDVPPGADFAVLLVEGGTDPRALPLPDLKDRAGSALGLAEDAGEGRVAVNQARKHLRAHGAVLGSRELVFTPGQFGLMGMESDAMREKLEILLRALVLDAERLRLRREGWEEPLD